MLLLSFPAVAHPSPENPKNKKCRRPAAGIKKHIGKQRSPRRHENLMDFIGRGKKEDNEEGQTGLLPFPRSVSGRQARCLSR